MAGKICPIFKAQALESFISGGKIPKGVKCVEDNCAWWEVNTKSCSINVLALNLRRLAKKK